MDIKKIKDSRTAWFGVSTLIILALIYIADLGRFTASVRSARLNYLIPALLLGIAVFPIWSYVWYRIFHKAGIELSFKKAVRIFMAGNFMNSITPLGQAGGEPLMAYLMQNNSEAGYEKSLSCILSADIINAVPNFTFLIGGTLYLAAFSSLNQFILNALYFALTIVAVGGGIVYFLWFESGTIESLVLKLAEKTSEKTGKGQETVEKLAEKLERIEKTFETVGKDPRYLVETAIFSHIAYLTAVLNFYLIMRSLGFTPNFTPIYFVTILSGLAGFSPTPGGSGTFEAAMAFFTTVFFPVSFATGLTAAILYRLSTYWPGLLLGYISLNTLQNGGGK